MPNDQVSGGVTGPRWLQRGVLECRDMGHKKLMLARPGAQVECIVLSPRREGDRVTVLQGAKDNAQGGSTVVTWGEGDRVAGLQGAGENAQVWQPWGSPCNREGH